MEPIRRTAARALLVSPEHEVLLLRMVLPGRTFWITPGGGAQPGETARQTIVRELHEETGVRGLPLGPEVWTRTIEYAFEGRTYRQYERYFLVHCSRFEPPAEMPDAVERRIVDCYRWWPLRAIERSSERFAPRRLGTLLRALIEQGAPVEPFDVGR